MKNQFKISVLFLSFLSASAGFSQQGNNWFFGKKAGLTFNSGQPSALLTGALDTYEGCASISDNTGKLLFYTDGVSIWNRNNLIMPNGSGLKGNPSSSNAAIIVPKPGSNTIYYVFTADASENQNLNGYNYSEVDMTLNGGLGDVTSNKNILLYAPSTEKLTAVRAANGIDVWVITHSWGDSGWQVFKVDCHGVNMSPIKSISGSAYNYVIKSPDPSKGPPQWNEGSVGCLKASPDGKVIATTLLTDLTLEIFNFDNTTGLISNPVSFYYFEGYGLEFSPNSKLLYVAGERWGYDTSFVTQFDLSNFNQTAIQASATIIGKVRVPHLFLDNIGALQLGPDNKIYCLLEFDSLLAVINSPNTAGISCNFVDSQVNLQGRIGTRGLPVFFPSLITNQNANLSFVVNQDCSTVDFTGTSSLANPLAWKWDFGDGSTGNGQVVSHAYAPNHELDTIVLTVSTATLCGTADATAVKLLDLRRITPKASFGYLDNCGNPQVIFSDSSTQATGHIQSWSWDFGDGILSSAQNPTHSYSSFGNFSVRLIVSSGGSCFGNDTVIHTIPIEPKPVAAFNFSKACENTPVLFKDISSITAGSIVKWYWSLGDGTSSLIQNPKEIYPKSNDFTIKLSVGSSTGCISDTSVQLIHISSKPTAQFTVSDTCPGVQTIFNSSAQVSNSSITNWWWNFGDGKNDNVQNPAHSFNIPGNYNIQLVVTAASGCISDSVKRNITIGAKPVADFSYTGECGNRAIQFLDKSAIAQNTIASWYWNFGDSKNSTIGSPIEHYPAYGIYNVSLVAKSSLGCRSDTTMKPIAVYAKPVSAFDMKGGCINQNVLFEDRSTIEAGNIINWNWNLGNGITNNVEFPQNIYPAFGNYTISLVVKSDKNCISDTLWRNINIETIPTAGFISKDGCANRGITPLNESNIQFGAIDHYYWDFGNGISSDQSQPLFSYSQPGKYLIKQIAISTNGCKSDTAYQSIQIEAVPVVDFSFGNACIGKEIEFSNLSSDTAGPIISYQWLFGNGDQSKLLSPEYTYHQYGYYLVTLSVNTKNGCMAFAEKIIAIENVKVFAGNDTTVAINQPLNLFATGAQNYEWSPSDNLSNNNIANPIAVLRNPATYFLKGTTNEGCVGYDTLHINVYKGPDAYVPNAFTPDHNGHNDIFRPVMPGIKELFFFSVYNRWGQLIFTTKEIDKGWDGTFNGINQPVGAYVWLLKLKTYQGNIIEKNGTVLLIR